MRERLREGGERETDRERYFIEATFCFIEQLLIHKKGSRRFFWFYRFILWRCRQRGTQKIPIKAGIPEVNSCWLEAFFAQLSRSRRGSAGGIFFLKCHQNVFKYRSKSQNFLWRRTPLKRIAKVLEEVILQQFFYSSLKLCLTEHAEMAGVIKSNLL